MFPVIWLALIGAIYSRIAPIFSLNRTFFPANEKTTLNIKQPIRFQGLFEATNQIAGKWKTEYNVANFATKILIFSLPKMDEFNFLQFLNDENEIFQAEEQHSRDFPTFRVYFGEFFWRFSTFSSSKSTWSQDHRVYRVSNKRRKSRATTRDLLSFQAMKYMSCAKWHWGRLGTDSSD